MYCIFNFYLIKHDLVTFLVIHKLFNKTCIKFIYAFFENIKNPRLFIIATNS